MSFLLSVNKLSSADIARINAFLDRNNERQALYQLARIRLTELLIVHKNFNDPPKKGKGILQVPFNPRKLQETKKVLSAITEEINTILTILGKIE